MAPKTIDIAIMFADIAGSTKLYETLGDQIAKTKIAESIETMSEITDQNNGTVVKTIGDEVMSIFPSVEDAGTAAWEIQEAFEDTTQIDNRVSPISVRIGLHFGPAITDDSDVFGDAVNVAARMVAQAKAKQIITTKETVNKLPAAIRSCTRFVDHAAIKGKLETIDIYEIIWQEEDATRMTTNIIAKKPVPEVKLCVSYQGRTIELSKKRPGLVLGRSHTCDLPVNEKLASRQHVRIELRRDKFYIIDQSTNGTHVLNNNSSEEFLRREEIALSGSGQISLGKGFNENPSNVVEFHHLA